MRYLAFFSPFIFAIMFSCSQKESKNQEVNIPNDNKELASLLSTYYEEDLKFNPLSATFSGDDRYNDTLTIDISEEFRSKRRAFFNKHKNELAQFDKETLSENDKTSIKVLKWECNINLKELEFPNHLMPVDQFWSTQLLIGQFASRRFGTAFQNGGRLRKLAKTGGRFYGVV